MTGLVAYHLECFGLRFPEQRLLNEVGELVGCEAFRFSILAFGTKRHLIQNSDNMCFIETYAKRVLVIAGNNEIGYYPTIPPSQSNEIAQA